MTRSVEFSTVSKRVTGVSHFHPHIGDRSKEGCVDPKTLITPVPLSLEFTFIGPSLPLTGPTQLFADLLPAPASVFTMGIDELPCDHARNSQQRHCQCRPERHLTTLHDRSLSVISRCTEWPMCTSGPTW